MKQVRYTLPWKPLDLWFIGDIQWHGDSKSVAIEYLKRTIEKALAAEQLGHTVRFIGMGDYTDLASPSNRARLKSANLYDTASDVIDQKALDLMDEVYEFLRPTRGKWLGLVEGHHFHELKDGTTTDMRLCEKLGGAFLGTTGLLHIQFQRPRSSQCIGFVLWAHHGTGNGQTGYYPLNRLEKIAAAWEQVDIFAMGHTTKSAHEFQNKVYPRWTRRMDLAHRKVILVGTGGYSKTYVEGAMQGRIPRGGYAEQRMLSASIIGSPVVHARPSTLRVGSHKGELRTLSLELTAEG